MIERNGHKILTKTDHVDTISKYEQQKAGGYMEKVVFSILVDNTSGVLSRIAGLFSRRGYNIDSLTVGVTADPR